MQAINVTTKAENKKNLTEIYSDLSDAVEKGLSAKIERTLEKVKPDGWDGNGFNPFYFAVAKNDAAIVAAFAKAGWNPAAKCCRVGKSTSVLEFAAARQAFASIRAMIDHGLDPDVEINVYAPHGYSFRSTLLEYAFDLDRKTTLKLLNAGANPDKVVKQRYKGQLLFQAVYQSDVEMVEALIQAGADVNVRDFKGETPAHFVPSKETEKSEYVFTLLVAAGADLNAKNRDGITPAQKAAKFSLCGRVALTANGAAAKQ